MLLSLVSASAARPARSRANRPTSSAAACCASAALPPLPKTSSFPPRSSAVRTATAASISGRGSALLTRSCSAIASANAALNTSLSSKAILLDVRPELLRRDLQRHRGRRMLVDLDRVILPERVTLPVLRHQQPPRIRVAVEHDAEQIPHFALEPVGSRPDAADGRHVRVGVVQPYLDPDPPPVRERHQDVNQLEPRFARIEVGGGQLGEEVELQIVAVAQQPRRRCDV